jgi:hypothetical protein
VGQQQQDNVSLYASGQPQLLWQQHWPLKQWWWLHVLAHADKLAQGQAAN